jgi:FkbM family methyltransferase
VIGAGLEFSGFIDREEYYYEGKTINLNGISYICTTKQDIVRSGNRFNLLAGVIDYSELEESRKEFGDCCEYIEYLDVYDSHMMEYKFLKNHAAELMEIYDTLCDDESKDVLEAYLHARYTGDVRSIVSRKHTGMLYDWELLGISDEDVLIDAGAYVGDSILEIKNEYGFIPKNVFALEPDRKNVVKLLDNFTPEEMVRIHPILAGLHERDGIMKFTDVGTVGSCLADDGGVSVKVHSLDEHQAYSAATVIKMDIEGSEPYAIRGGVALNT